MKFNLLTLLFISLTVVTFTACKEKSSESGTQETTETSVAELTPEEIQQFTETGKMIAQSTFIELSGNLKKALKEGGVKEAAEYCNIVAMPLTDSLSGIHNASIKRTSLKLRNPENKATAEELKILNEYESLFAGQQALKPMVKSLDLDYVQFYAPIMTKQLCLSCHGTIGEELTAENYAILKELYPEDKATGYAENDFRGMWSIKIKKESL